MSALDVSKVTLRYWGGRGLMEVPRMLLAVAGHFPGDYVDGRYNAPTGDLTQNLGRMPVLELGDGRVIGQSAAINFYLASELGLLGANSFEAARIVALCEHVKELVSAYRTLVPYGTEATPEALEKWFEGGEKDTEGPAGSGRTRYLTWYLARIEAVLCPHGFAVGSKISLADLTLYNALAEFLTPEQAGELPLSRREMFCDKARTDAAIAKHPKIQAAITAVASHPNMQKWLSVRGVQGF